MTPDSCSRKALLPVAVVAFLLMTGTATPIAHAFTPVEKLPCATVNPATLEELACRRFRDLNPMELRVVQSAARGDFARGDNDGSKNAAVKQVYDKSPIDPVSVAKDGWFEHRRVRADLLRWLSENEEARRLVDPHGINISGVWIDGALDLSYLHINFPINVWKSLIPDGIDLNSAELSELELLGSEIGRSSELYVGQALVALNGEGLTVHGSVLLGDGFHAFHQVDLYEAKIEGLFYCSEGEFSNPGKDSLLLRLANIGGEIALDRGFRSDGLVDLDGAKIGGDLLINDADFSAHSDNGLTATNLTARELDWTAVAISDRTKIDLSDSKVDIFVLTDNQKSWPKKANLTIDGFVYGDFDEKGDKTEKKSIDVSDGLRWLQLQAVPRPIQPYMQLAKMFRDNGQKSEETKVLIDEETDMRQHAEPRPTLLGMPLRNMGTSLVGGVSWLTFGYGYKPLFALGWIAAFVAFGTFTFHRGYQTGLVIPTEHDAYELFKDTHVPPAGYQPFNSFVYSLETFVPLIELHQVGYWLPYPQTGQKSSQPAGRLLRWYLWAHIVFGWFFTSLLVAGLAGLVKNG